MGNRSRKPLRSHSWTDLGLASLLAIACLVSVEGLALAFAGWFSLLSLLAAILAAAWVSWWIVLRMRRHGDEGGAAFASMRWTRADGLYIGVLVVGALVYLRPGEPIAGNWDPGVYLAQGAALAEDGTYLFHDEAGVLLDTAARDALYPVGHGRRVKYPGFYVASSASSRLEPQFFPLFPVWIGAAASVGSVRPALVLTGILSMVSLVLLVKLGERLGGPICAAACGILFLLNPVQIWFSGFPTGEVLMQFFFLAGLWCWVLWLDEEHSLTAWLAGACLALTMFTSVTGILLAALCGAAFLPQSGRGRGAPGLFVPTLCLLPLLVVQNLFFTRQYFETVSGYAPSILAMLTAPKVSVPLVVVGLVAVACKSRWADPYRKPIRAILRPAALAAGVAALALLAYVLFAGDPMQARVRLLSAMVSRVTLLAAALGLILLTWKRPRVGWTLLFVGGIFTYVFLTSRMMVRLYPWAFKRHLSVTLPLACLCAGYAWSCAAAWGRHPVVRVVVLVLVLVLGARLMYRGRAFAFHRDWSGLLDFTEQVSATLPDDGVVFADKWIATPLEFIHGRRVLPLPPYPDTFSPDHVTIALRLASEGYSTYFVYEPGNGGTSFPSGESLFSETLETSLLDQSREPFGARPRARTIHLEVLRLGGDEQPTPGEEP